MDKIVITIARYYGSGGKTIGEMLGKELNIPFYNREILRMASDDSGINEALFAQADEKLKKTSLCSIIRQRSSAPWRTRNPASSSDDAGTSS